MANAEERFEEWQQPEIEDGKLTKWHWVVKGVDRFTLGHKTDIGAFTYIHAEEEVVIEDYVEIGGHCRLYSVSTIDNKRGKIHIKKNAKVGAGSTILPGVTIGENSVIGAHSLVKDHVPDNSIAWGTPAKIMGVIVDGKIILHKRNSE